MVLWALENALGGEIFVPKIPSYNIVDLANAIDPMCDLQIVGTRPGEKLHEEMITVADSQKVLLILENITRYFLAMAVSKKNT